MKKNKYKVKQSELIESVIEAGRDTAVLRVEVVDTSKIEGHLIYHCIYLHTSKVKETYIIAKDITDAMNRLEPYLKAGTTSDVINYILGSETFNKIK
jgi:predicted transcriptional regulator